MQPVPTNLKMTITQPLPHLEWSLLCDRCNNMVRWTRKVLPVDPTTFCDNCRKETES